MGGRPGGSNLTSTTRQTVMTIDLGGEQVLLKSIVATEALGQLFDFTVAFVAPLGEVDLLPHLGKPVLVTAREEEELQRYFHGILTEGRFVKESPTGFHYELTVKPWAYQLSQNSDFAIYQELDAVSIVKRVFAEANMSDVDYTRLSRARAKRTYTVQYRESDFAFVSRLLEQEGIYYFFEHSADRHVMVLCEGPSSHRPGTPPALTFNPDAINIYNVGSVQRSESRKHFVQHWHESVASGTHARVMARDFDFERPEKPLEAKAEGRGHHPGDATETFVYPGRWVDEGEGAKLGQVALDAQRAMRKRYSGQSQAAALHCGSTVAITDHPNVRMNRDYLITKAVHSLTAESYRTGDEEKIEDYNVVIDAIPSDTVWAPPQVTPQPVARGLDTAIVTGPEGEEIFTDQYGRVKVRFHWDRADTPGEKSTCWIRVSQTGGLGNVILPRVGHEVLVDFLDGDPDRPLVVGRVFNRRHMPVYPLPENKTRAVWRTKTYGPTGQYAEAEELDSGKPSSNEIRFEDKGGSEEMYIHAERDMNTRVRLNQTHNTGRNHSARVGNDRSCRVGNHDTMDVVGKQVVTVGATQTVTVTGDMMLESKAKITLKVGGSTIVMDSAGITIKATTITVDGTTVLVKSGEADVGAKGTLKLHGKMTEINTG